MQNRLEHFGHALPVHRHVPSRTNPEERVHEPGKGGSAQAHAGARAAAWRTPVPEGEGGQQAADLLVQLSVVPLQLCTNPHHTYGKDASVEAMVAMVYRARGHGCAQQCPKKAFRACRPPPHNVHTSAMAASKRERSGPGRPWAFGWGDLPRLIDTPWQQMHLHSGATSG